MIFTVKIGFIDCLLKQFANMPTFLSDRTSSLSDRTSSVRISFLPIHIFPFPGIGEYGSMIAHQMLWFKKLASRKASVSW